MAHSVISLRLITAVMVGALFTPRAFGSESCDVKSAGLGTTYTRWGRTSCPDTASLVYEGVVAKSFYTQTGGGKNYICLHKQPQWLDSPTSEFDHRSYIYGVEYEHINPSDFDAPCAVCHVTGRGDQLMIPGRMSCPFGWTEEYYGMLVSSHFSHQGATYECLDKEPEAVLNSGVNHNGGLFYRVEAACGGSLPCPPYVNGYELTCVVCTI